MNSGNHEVLIKAQYLVYHNSFQLLDFPDELLEILLKIQKKKKLKKRTPLLLQKHINDILNSFHSSSVQIVDAKIFFKLFGA